MASTVPMAIQIVTSGDIAAANSMARVAGAVDKVDASTNRAQSSMKQMSASMLQMSGVPPQVTTAIYAMEQAYDSAGGSMKRFANLAAGAGLYAVLGAVLLETGKRMKELKAAQDEVNASLPEDSKLSFWRELGSIAVNVSNKMSPVAALISKAFGDRGMKEPGTVALKQITAAEKADIRAKAEQQYRDRRDAADAKMIADDRMDEEKAKARFVKESTDFALKQASAEEQIAYWKEEQFRIAQEMELEPSKRFRLSLEELDAQKQIAQLTGTAKGDKGGRLDLAIAGSQAYARAMSGGGAGGVENQQLSTQRSMLAVLTDMQRQQIRAEGAAFLEIPI